MAAISDLGGWPAILETLASSRDITSDQAQAALGAILAGRASDAQVAAFAVMLRLKGPTANELLGLATAMRQAATPLDIPEEALDIVGTGGTSNRRAHALNVSTMACFVAAGAGATVCKHGSVKASSTSGSFDLLAALGVPVGAAAEQVAETVRAHGLGFAFAKTFHPAMRHVAPVRSQVGISTVFNLLGPLSHPGRVKRQVLGVLDESLAPVMAEVLQALGSVRSLVVHGDGQFDEFTTTGANQVWELNDGAITQYTVQPGDVGLRSAEPQQLRGGAASDNVRILTDVLAGEGGPYRDIVVFNAAAALYAAGIAADLPAGAAAAAAALDDGRAAAKLRAVTAPPP
ncbi:MAG: anthranilate phosphoribosyltransferase [Acidimicrobiaceae bacterium]|nr:anthranilate phosphoribosyltransferase [Acidimicrobiaceae bacterium]